MPKNLNSTILASAWLSATDDFQQAIPRPTQQNMAEVVGAFQQPNAGKYFNEVTGLFNTIGRTRIDSRRWEDPLAFLEKGFMQYGYSLRQIAVPWVETRSYDSNSQTLLKRELGKFVEAFHSIDRFTKYERSVVENEFLQSLSPSVGGDGYGLDTFLGAIFDSIYSKEAYDSMQLTLQVLAEADEKFEGGIMRMNVAEPTNEATGKAFIEALQTIALRWRFPSTIYNNVEGLPVFTPLDEIVILTTPEYYSALSVQVVASAFQLDASDIEEVRRRIVLVPSIPIANCGAVIADRDFWLIYRTIFRLENFYNPDQLSQKYILHSQGVWSANPFANIVLLGEFDSTQIPTITMNPTSLVLTPDEVTVAPGGKVNIASDLRGTVTANAGGTGKIGVKPDSVIWDVTIASSEDEPRVLNQRTFVDRFGTLHVQKTGVEIGDTITVNAKSTYINPSGATSEIAATPVTIEIVQPTDIDTDGYDKLVYTEKNDAVVLNGDIVDAANYDED